MYLLVCFALQVGQSAMSPPFLKAGVTSTYAPTMCHRLRLLEVAGHSKPGIERDNEATVFARHNVTINNLLPSVFDTDAQRNQVAGIVARRDEGFAALWASQQAANPAGW